MRKKSNFLWLMTLSAIVLILFSERTDAACRNPNLVIYDDTYILRGETLEVIAENRPFIIPVAASSGFTEITWFGHSFFQMTSSAGTKIITDPFAPMGFPMPDVWPHIVTVGREYRNHNNVGLAKGSPLVLRGLKEGTLQWHEINLTYRDVLIYNVPIHQRGYTGYEGSIKGAAFVFEMDGMCVLHSGDVSEPFNEDQLQLIGHIDVLMVPIGGRWTAGPEEAREIIDQLKPKIVVPMHYWYQGVLDRLTAGPHPAKFLDTNTFMVSKETLPPVTEIIVPKVVWQGRDEDF